MQVGAGMQQGAGGGGGGGIGGAHGFMHDGPGVQHWGLGKGYG